MYPVRLGQVRISIAIKSSIIQNTKAPIHSLGCFGQKFERTVFERTTMSHRHCPIGIFNDKTNTRFLLFERVFLKLRGV